MPIFRGRDGAVEVGANTVLRLQSWSFSETQAQIETDSMGDTWGGTLGDINRASGEIVFYLDDTSSANGQTGLTLGAAVTLRLYEQGNATGRQYRTGPAVVSQIAAPVGKGDVVTVTASWVSNGAWTKATVPA